MTDETNSPKQESQKTKVINRSAASAPIYGLGLIGAWLYYISHATTFWIGLLGIFKGIFWPAMLVYEAMKYLGM